MSRRIRILKTVTATTVRVCLCTATFVNCGPQSAQNYENHEVRARINPVLGEPDTTILTLVEDDEATSLMAKLQADQRDSQMRRALANHYGTSFPNTSLFYQATADVLEGQEPALPPWPIRAGFRCDVAVGPESHEVYLELSRRFAFATPEQMPTFVAAVEQAMKEHGNSCDLIVLWSRAVVRQAEWKPAVVSLSAQEKAARTLLDVAETYTPLHEGEPSPELYLDLAGYFVAARHDYAAAYVATRWAEQRLTLSKKPPELRDRYLEHIERYLIAFESHLPRRPGVRR